MLPLMNYKKYIYGIWVIAAVNLKFDIVPQVNEYLQQSVFDTELGAFTVFSALTCVALAFFSASVSDNLMRFVQTSSRNTLTTFIAAGVFIIGFISTVDIIQAFVTDSDRFIIDWIVGFIENPQGFTDLFMNSTGVNDTMVNNSSLEV